MLNEEPERRWVPTLLVAAAVLLMAGGLPMLDASMHYRPAPQGGHVNLELQGTPTRPGTVTRPRATLVPSAGWARSPSDRDDDGSASLVSAGASMQLRIVPAESDSACGQSRVDAAQELSDDFGLAPTGAGVPIATADGIAGTVTAYSSALVDGLVFVACAHGVAVVATATGPAGARANGLVDVNAMLASIRFQ